MKPSRRKRIEILLGDICKLFNQLLCAHFIRLSALSGENIDACDCLFPLLLSGMDNSAPRAKRYSQRIYGHQLSRRLNSRRRKQSINLYLKQIAFLIEGDYERFAKSHIRIHYHSNRKDLVNRAICYSDLRKRGAKKRGPSKKL